MENVPCLNPNCKSHGKSHPNCACFDHLAKGGEVSHFCATNGDHQPDCQYYVDGGEVEIPETPPTQVLGSGRTDKDLPAFADGGEIGFVPDAAPSAPANDLGFQPDDQQAALQAKHGTLPEQAMAGLEGAGEGIMGPLSPMLEEAVGIPREDIKAREQANPITHGIGQVAGLAGSAATGVGEMGLLGAAGAGAAKMVEGAVAKTAVKMGVESALYTLGDEFSKAVKGDASTVQAAAAHVGLSALLGAGSGGVLGKVSDTWVNNVGPKASSFVNDFVSALKGDSVASDVAGDLGLGELSKSPGIKAGEKFVDWIANGASEAVSDLAGVKLGHMTGFPGAGYLGAIFGHRVIKPMVDSFMPAIADTLLTSETSVAGLKSAFDTMDAMLSGVHAMDKGADALFKVTTTKALDHLIPDKATLTKLDEHLSSLDANPEKMMNISGEVGHYMPAHAAALAMTAQNAVNYLQSQKPRSIQSTPLDKPIDPSPSQQAAYNRTLEVAESPLAVLSRIYKGTLQPQDLKTLNTVYPHIAPSMQKAVFSAMTEHIAKGNNVPYGMRSSLSLFLGQPLDSTFTPGAMAAAQSTYVQAPPPPPQSGKAKKGTSKLGKSAEAAATPAERRQEALSKP